MLEGLNKHCYVKSGVCRFAHDLKKKKPLRKLTLMYMLEMEMNLLITMEYIEKRLKI
jgi:hypothetical protein